MICDDIEKERHSIKELLTHFFLARNEEFAIQEYDCGETLLADVEAKYIVFDMLFLDIYMEKMDGMETARRRIAVKTRRHMRYFYVDEIVWIDSDKHTVTLHFTDGTAIATNKKLNTIEKQINDSRFLRCYQRSGIWQIWYFHW